MHFPSYDTIYSPLSHSLGKRYISRMSRCTCILSGHALTSFYTTGQPQFKSIIIQLYVVLYYSNIASIQTEQVVCPLLHYLPYYW